MLLTNLIKIYRVGDWFHYIGFFILGYSLYQLNIDFLFFLQIVEVSLMLSYAYSLNQFFDKKMAKKNMLFFLVPLFLALVLLVFFDMTKTILIIIFMVLVALYSIPKIKLKSLPMICSFSNNVGFSLLFLLGASNNLVSNLTIKFFFLLFFLQSAAQFIHEIAHFSEDKKEGLTTTAILFGKNQTKKAYSFFLVLASIVSLTFVDNTISFLLLTIPTVLFSSYFILSANKIKITELRKEYRFYGILIGSLFLLNNIII